jgi:hypothetical protein
MGRNKNKQHGKNQQRKTRVVFVVCLGQGLVVLRKSETEAQMVAEVCLEHAGQLRKLSRKRRAAPHGTVTSKVN